MVDPSLRPGWPAHLAWGPVELHPPRRRDAEEWSRVRIANEAWLAPWEPTAAGPWAARHTPAAYRAMRRAVLRRAAMGFSLPFVVRVEGRLAGQVTIDNVVRGALRSGNLGYWVDRAVAGRGMASLAVALVCDHAFGPARLHRLGFRREGLLRRYLDIDGDWRDHDTFALLAEDLPGGVLARWRERSAQRP